MSGVRERRIPKRLAEEPLVEAIWEQRFELCEGATGEILLGALYQAMHQQFPRIVRLLAANIPRPIAREVRELRYLPTVRLEATGDRPLAIQVGDRVVSFNNWRPYQGWRRFSRYVQQLNQVLRETNLICATEQFSLRYIDLLQLESPPSLSGLRVRVELATHDLSRRPVYLRTELSEPPFVQVVQLTSPAKVIVHNGSSCTGTIVDIQTILRFETSTDDPWAVVEGKLDDMHNRTRNLLFRLLDDHALERLRPICDGGGAIMPSVLFPEQQGVSVDLSVEKVEQADWATQESHRLCGWQSLLLEASRSESVEIEMMGERDALEDWLKRLDCWIKSAPPAPPLPQEATRRERIYG